MITDEMKIKAMSAYLNAPDGVSSGIEAALEAVAADIRNAAIEAARDIAAAQRRGRQGYNNDFERGAMAMSHTIEGKIEALKTKVTP